MWSDNESSDGESESECGFESGSVAVAADETNLYEDPWDASIRTSVVPIVIKPATYKGQLRSLASATEPPRTGISPHGFTFKTWLHNFKKAVAAGNVSHTIHCLGSYFIWFQAAELLGDVGVIRLVPLKNENLWTQLQEQACAGGVLNNRWSAFLHQQLHLSVWDVFLEVVGVCGSLLVPRLQELWRQYELSLLSVPERSLSKLLTIGLMLARAVKNGAVFYAAAAFGSTAKARKRREQVVKSPHVVRNSVAGDLAEAVLSTLGSVSPVVYTQRQKKNLYREWYLSQPDALRLSNLVQLLQALPASEKKALKIFTRHKELALQAHVKIIDAIQLLYSSLFREPNGFACHRFTQYILQQLVVYSHLLATSTNTDIASRPSQEEVSFAFCEQFWETLQGTAMVMIYGVTTEKIVCHSAQYKSTLVSLNLDADARKNKKRKMTVAEQEELKFNGGPSTVAISHEGMFAATKCRDGFFTLADFVPHSNWATSVLPELEALYFTCCNIGVMKRQYNRQSKSRHVATDGSFVDFAATAISRYSERACIVPLQKHPVSNPNPRALYELWTGEDDAASLLFEFLTGLKEDDASQYRPRVWFVGPLRTREEEGYLLGVELKRKLGFHTDHQVRSLILSDYPQEATSDLVCGRPYLFFTESVPAPVDPGDRENGSKSCKLFGKYVKDIKTASLSLATDRGFQEQCMLAAVVYDVFGSERDWDFTYVIRDYGLSGGHVLASSGKLVLSALPMVVFNETRSPGVYQRLHCMYDGNDADFVNAIRSATDKVLAALETLVDVPEWETIKGLLSQDLEIDVEKK
jgi:hypothetical protein